MPLSVYYVNCDVDSPPVETAAAEFPSPSAPPASAPKEVPRDAPMPKAVPKAVLDIWSQPAGADIALDGAYVGKTPYSLAVPPGEHRSHCISKTSGLGSAECKWTRASINRRLLGTEDASLGLSAAPPGAPGPSISSTREESHQRRYWSSGRFRRELT